MKNLITVFCLFCLAGCVFAEPYEIPGSRVETTTEVLVEDGKQVKETKVKRKRIFKRRDTNPTNTYWNFGKVPFWTGSI